MCPMAWSSSISGLAVPVALESRLVAEVVRLHVGTLTSSATPILTIEFRTAYFGMGRMMSASSVNDASPALPLIRYWIFNCFVLPGSGSPPKLVL